MANDHPLDAKGARLSVGDTIVVVNNSAIDKGMVGKIKHIYGESVRYHGTERAWEIEDTYGPPARQASSLVKIPKDVAKDPKLIDAFLVLSGLKAPRD